jgi:malate synthase
MSITLPQGMQITGAIQPGFETILTPEALAFVADLHRTFEARRQELLAARVERTARLDAGERPDFLESTRAIREGDWKVAPLPAALACRRVEITGPVEAKMVINAFNSGADSYMTDFEDSNAPKWENQVQGQINLAAAIRRTLTLEQNGKSYKLNERIATLQVRPRGWHLDETACSCSTTPRNRSRAAPARSSTCPRWKAISRRACGTTCSCARRTSWACRKARSRPPC